MRYTYTEIDRVEIEGATFDLCPIPSGVWRTLQLEGFAAVRAAQRRQILAAKAAGEQVDEDTIRATLTLEAEYRSAIEGLERRAVAWGVRGHSGLPYPFAAAERDYFGRKYAGASEETVCAYADTRLEDGSGLLHVLYLKLHEKNDLVEGSKKNSASPPDTTASDGTAPTAQEPHAS
jgi:hypothetical protein